MELIGESHLDVAEDNYRVVPLRDNLLLLHGPHYVNVIKLGDSVLFSSQLDDTNKRNIFRYLQSTNKILHVGKDNTVKIMSTTAQGIFVFGDTLNDSAVRISFQESVYLLEILQNSGINWGPDTEELSQKVEFYLQNKVPELQMQPQKKQQWLECILEGTYQDLEPLLEDISSQQIQDANQSATITKMLQRLRYNSSHHLKHPSPEAVVSTSVSPTEEIAVTGSSDGKIAIWDISQTPRLVNTISGPAGLIAVLLGEVVVAVHRPNIVIVHQIGEHALSETLFQQAIGEGIEILGASYVPATQKVVLVLKDVIASPSKPSYFLQTASINLEDHSLELSERVRVEGSFVAIATTKSTNTVSIDAAGRVVLFDSSSGVISNTLQTPQSNYKFSDVTSSGGFVYAATLAGTVLSFNLANISRSSSSPVASQPNSHFETTTTTDASEDPFGDFSAPQGGGDDDFGFGDFEAASSPATNGATPQRNGTFGSEEDDFGFGNSSSFATPHATSGTTEQSPRFSLDEPGAGIAGSVASHNSSTGDFGELPRQGNLVDAGSSQNSPVIGSKLRQSFDFQQSPYTSPSIQRKSPPPAEFGQFSTSPPVERKSPQPNPFDTQQKATDNHPFETFGGQDQFGDFGSDDTFGDFGSQGQIGDFGTQDQFGDFGATPQSQSNGHSASQSQLATTPQDKVGDFGDFADFASHSSSSQTSSDFGTAQNQNAGELGNFSTTPDSTTPPATTPPPLSPANLHSSTSSHTSSPSTPGLHGSNFRVSASILPTSPSIFSQDFGFETPPPTTLSHSPPPARQSPNADFGDFGTNFVTSPSSSSSPTPTPPITTQTSSPKPPHVSSPKQVESTFGDFGELAASPKPQARHQSAEDFSFDESFANPATDDGFGDFGTSTPHTGGDFGDFGETTTPATHTGDFGETTSPVAHTGDFGETTTSVTHTGNFGETTPATHTGNFGETTATTHTGDFGETEAHANTFGDFGESAAPTTHTANFGDFGDSPPAHPESFGDFGESPSSVQADFGEFSANQPTVAAAQASDDFGDFGDFSAPSEHKDDDDFGDFGDFSKPQDANDDDFGDFGGFASVPSSETHTTSGFGETETSTASATSTSVATAPPTTVTPPAAAPVAATPQIPSVFSQDDKQLEETLNNTFTTAFASLVPPALQSTPSSPSRASVLSGLDLEASLKQDKDRKPKCAQCGVVLRSGDAPTCLACGALVGPPQVSTWLGVVLPPIAEIKFWDALGVPLKQMTETTKETQSLPALSSSQGILTPTISAMPSTTAPLAPTQAQTQTHPPSSASTQATPPTLSSSWDFSENPFAPSKATNFEFESTGDLLSAATAPAGKTPAATPATAARPAQHAAQNAQPSAAQGGGGFGDADFMAGPFSPSSQTSSFGSSRPPSSTPPAPTPRSADDDFFLNFEPSSTSTSSAPSKSSILTAPPPVTHASPASQFLSRIPDLSFAVADHLVIPSH